MTTRRPHPADSLATIRRHLGDLHAALTEPTVHVPLFTRPSVAAVAAMRDRDIAERADRTTLAWGETPAPLDLDAADTLHEVTAGLIELEDAVRDALCEPVVRRAPIADPDARRAAAHWAAVAVTDRLSRRADGPWMTSGSAIWEHVQDETERLAHLVLRALGTDDAPVRMPWPCPWCGGVLLLHTDQPSRGAYATCGTGESCTAPVGLEDGRRLWGYRALPALADRAQRPAA